MRPRPTSAGNRAIDGDGAGPDVDRRTVLKSIGATLAMASAVGCDGEPDGRALPYASAPEFLVPGEPRLFATAVLLGGYAQPVIGTTHDGRPTKLEGNPDHPASSGVTDAFTQAALMGLYDPHRSSGPLRDGQPTSWAAFARAMASEARALDMAEGEGLRILTGQVTSPTMFRQLADLRLRWPRARWHVWEPLGDNLLADAAVLAFGRPATMHADLSAAEVVVSLDDDLLGPGPRQTFHAAQWARRRTSFRAGDARSELHVAEPTPSLTGAKATHRLAARAGMIPALVHALAGRLGVPGVATPELDAAAEDWIERAASTLDGARGRSLVTIGPYYPAEVQAVGLLVNERLGNLGRTLRLTEPLTARPDRGSLAALAEDMRNERVEMLAMINTDPVYSAPGELGFVEALATVGTRVHAGLHDDETAALCHWHVPLQHALESWTDARAADGQLSIVQPLVRPFLSVRSPHTVLETLQGLPERSDHDIVAETWRLAWGETFDARWREALRRGLVSDGAPGDLSVTPQTLATSSLPDLSDPQAIEVLIRPDPCVWDGSLAANPWLQELPKPMTKVAWDAPVAVSEALAAEIGAGRGDEVRLTAGGITLTGAVYAVPGQAERTVVLSLGYGRQRGAGDADGASYNAALLRHADGTLGAISAGLRVTGESLLLATTQRVGDMEGQALVRTVAAAAAEAGGSAHERPSFYPERVPESPSWGMSIDLDACIGCNACVVACIAENNIAMVGRDEVAEGREMHWLRVDRYWDGDAIHFQPVPCMHCEHAPCEMGCPVNATVHSEDGLNLQVYNRCIGTRTCSSYCPYKVRRFNWFDLTGDDPPSVQASRNPDVTVRGRGVMEKCTYCIQRISAARIAAKRDDRPIADGEVRTACQQACPTQAIVFGDVTDPDTAVSQAKAEPRDYTLLEEVNTRPRTTYLARIAPEEEKIGDAARRAVPASTDGKEGE